MSGQVKGFAFIEYSTTEEAKAALEVGLQVLLCTFKIVYAAASLSLASSISQTRTNCLGQGSHPLPLRRAVHMKEAREIQSLKMEQGWMQKMLTQWVLV